MSGELYGQVRVTEAENREHEYAMFAKRSMEVPSNMKMRCDYGSRPDGQPVYQGFAAKGVGTDQEGWLLYYLTYNASGNMTQRDIAYGAWDSRATYTYE